MKRKATSTSATGASPTTQSQLSGSTNIQQYRKRICQTVQYSPYLNWKEHDDVGLALLSLINNNDGITTGSRDMSIQDALIRVSIWKNRSVRISHAIECTAALAQILYRDLYHHRHHNHHHHDQSCNADTATSSSPTISTTSMIPTTTTTTTTTTELRNAYASAIVRSVNGLADTIQQQRSVATSIAILCTEIGLPKWIVSIRHEATHNQLPSLSVLRITTKTLLQYFDTVYWLPIRQRHETYIHHIQHVLLQQYDTAVMYKIQQSNDQKQEQQHLINEKKKEIHQEREKHDTLMNDNEDSDFDANDTLNYESIHLIDDQSLSGTTFNRFAPLLLLHNQKSKDKQLKRQQETTESNIQSTTTKKKKKLKITQSDKKETQRNNINIHQEPKQQPATNIFTVAYCAKEFIKTNIPINILHQVIIDTILQRTKEYIINANYSNTPSMSTATSNTTNTTTNAASSNTNASTLQLLEHISPIILYNHYRPLFGSICRIWPGFLTTFLLHCIQHIIQIETDIIHDDPNDTTILPTTNFYNSNNTVVNKQCDDSTKEVSIINDDTAKNELRTTKISIKDIHSLYGTVLEGWVHLLLSKSFLYQLEIQLPSTAIYDSKISGEGTINTVTTRTYLQERNKSLPFIVKSPCTYDGPSLIFNNKSNTIADIELLNALQYPLNRLCDQLLLSFQKQNQSQPIENDVELLSVHSASSSSVRSRLIYLLQLVLGKERSLNYGIGYIPIATNKQNNHKTGATSITAIEQTIDVSTNVKGSDTTPIQKLSLEDMETLLFQTKTCDPIVSNNRDVSNNNETRGLHMTNESTNCNNNANHDTNNTSASASASTEVSNTSKETACILRSNWVQCQSWDPCSIGSNIV